MAHDLDLAVVAEGVETKEQLKVLKKIECDEVQGFLFSRPLPCSRSNRICPLNSSKSSS